jgi:hypothetical protein
MINSLVVVILNDTISLTLDTNESYSLNVEVNGATITADNGKRARARDRVSLTRAAFGAIHALESFSQLVAFDGTTYSYARTRTHTHACACACAG